MPERSHGRNPGVPVSGLIPLGERPPTQESSWASGYCCAVSYQWIRFLHIASAIGFVGIHGASIVVLYAIRNERDRDQIESLLGFSARTVIATYLSLAAVVGTGLWLGFKVTSFFSESWYWWALAVLVLTGLVMWFLAKPFTRRLRSACEIRPSGIPRKSDEELDRLLRSPRSHVITAIGVGGLGAILYLMVFQPLL